MRATGFARACLLGLLVLAAPGARAQQPSQSDEGSYALGYLLGRYRMPVTCTLASGEIVEREESIVVRAGPAASGRDTVRVTYFGVDAPEATRCYNLVFSRIPDRRGVVILAWEGYGRTDLGLRDFKQELKRGVISYHVVGGQLELRDPEGASPPRVVTFERDGSRFVVTPVTPESDGQKLLARMPPSASSRTAPRPPRRFEFRLSGVDGLDLGGYYLEDATRTR
jgi:hypothetical protein